VDFANSRIAVASAKLRSNRYVTIGPKTILLLKARKDRQQASEFVFGENRLALFNRMLHQLPEFVKRSDAGSVSFHCLRHMFAARVVSAGASPFTLFLILGYVLGYSTLSFASSPNRQFEEAARSLALLEEF
jgi:integrase